MLAHPPAAVEKNEAKRKDALATLDRKLKDAIRQPDFFGRITVEVVIQQGRIEIIEDIVRRTTKT